MAYVSKFDFAQSLASRVFVLEEGSEDRYKMWRVLNREVAFEVDVSSVPCGIGANVYFVGMEADGGLGREGNRAGARYGTGYCDAGCRKNMRFVGGEVCLVLFFSVSLCHMLVYIHTCVWKRVSINRPDDTYT